MYMHTTETKAKTQPIKKHKHTHRHIHEHANKLGFKYPLKHELFTSSYDKMLALSERDEMSLEYINWRLFLYVRIAVYIGNIYSEQHSSYNEGTDYTEL